MRLYVSAIRYSLSFAPHGVVLEVIISLLFVLSDWIWSNHLPEIWWSDECWQLEYTSSFLLLHYLKEGLKGIKINIILGDVLRLVQASYEVADLRCHSPGSTYSNADLQSTIKWVAVFNGSPCRIKSCQWFPSSSDCKRLKIVCLKFFEAISTTI